MDQNVILMWLNKSVTKINIMLKIYVYIFFLTNLDLE